MSPLKTWLVMFFFCVFCGNTWADIQQEKALQAKAIFIYNFANFVEWPDDAFLSTNSPLKVCLYGSVPFGIFLDAVNGTLIGQRQLMVVRTANIETLEDGCQILFVGQDKRAQLPDFWSNIKYVYVLSVGEQEGFVDNGGVINILRTTDRVQFQINISNALEQGLFLSSDLLSLAREVKRNTTKNTE
ncbi:YfiR family protein [Marinibactrum halimedae]|uniref:YfiR family protein n=1 Tax=Marinibactrum halimedae TaxID=1444977 RepID=A0AA37T4P1_9GAMM|nr:YfiR family protein [Marinibactrum halimedae]MCD9459647.1 YfiR family protein [Marinibactrum halimedae]GLS25674.1 hypothetical protein GCM10007877_13880 [Marinibactrum halimedae]